METKIIIVRNRTLRRRQKAELIKELEADLAIIDARLIRAISPREVIAYTKLYDAVYGAYLSAISSEV